MMTLTEDAQSSEQLRDELSSKLDELHRYCMSDGTPIFIAAWLPPEKKKNDGYIYEMVSPIRLDISLNDDRFPHFLGGILGFDRAQFYG